MTRNAGETAPKATATKSSDGQRPAIRRRLSSEERRQEFISKAVEFFAEEGFQSSTRELARRLGVTQPLLYRYFPSKDDLISEVYNLVYLKRWRHEWEGLLADRSRPVRERMVEFYQAYTDVVFNRDWMRIFLFSGLKGVDINTRYLKRVRQRILEPIIRECRHEAGFAPRDASEREIEYAWVMHGGIFHFGIRKLIYEGAESIDDKSFMIEASMDAFIAQLRLLGEEA